MNAFQLPSQTDCLKLLSEGKQLDPVQAFVAMHVPDNSDIRPALGLLLTCLFGHYEERMQLITLENTDEANPVFKWVINYIADENQLPLFYKHKPTVIRCWQKKGSAYKLHLLTADGLWIAEVGLSPGAPPPPAMKVEQL